MASSSNTEKSAFKKLVQQERDITTARENEDLEIAESKKTFEADLLKSWEEELASTDERFETIIQDLRAEKFAILQDTKKRHEEKLAALRRSQAREIAAHENEMEKQTTELREANNASSDAISLKFEDIAEEQENERDQEDVRHYFKGFFEDTQLILAQEQLHLTRTQEDDELKELLLKTFEEEAGKPASNSGPTIKRSASPSEGLESSATVDSASKETRRRSLRKAKKKKLDEVSSSTIVISSPVSKPTSLNVSTTTINDTQAGCMAKVLEVSADADGEQRFQTVFEL